MVSEQEVSALLVQRIVIKFFWKSEKLAEIIGRLTELIKEDILSKYREFSHYN